MKTILITGVRAPISLDFCRSFKKYGAKVILADALQFPISRWSNSVSNYYKLFSPKHQTKQFIAQLQQIIEREQVTDIIPLCEETFYISMYKSVLNCKVWTADFSTMNALHNKLLFSQFSNLPTVKSEPLEHFTDWENSQNYVFKPIYSRFASSTIINQSIHSNFISDEEKKNWIVQKFIQGNEICPYSIWENGRLKGYACYQPTYRAGKGASIFFQPTNHEKTFQLIKQFGEKLNYTGQMSFDVMIDKDNQPHFLECNPRGTSGAHLLNLHLAKCFLTETFIHQTKTNYSLKYGMAIYHFAALFTKKVKEANDVIYNSTDKMPFFMQWLSFLEIVSIWAKKKGSLLSATTENIEWNGN